MKHQETMTDRIVKNFNQALGAIPRALSLEDSKPVKRARPRKKARKTVSSSAKRTISSGVTTARRAAKKAKRKVSSLGKKAVRGKRKGVKKASSRAKRSTKSRRPTMAKSLRKVARKITPRTRKTAIHQTTVARAA